MNETCNNSAESKTAIEAYSIVQTVNIAADNATNPAYGTTRVILAPEGAMFTFVADPFDSSMGRLDSFTVSFLNFQIEISGTAAGKDAGISASFTGNFSIDGIHFNGYGTSSSRSAGRPLTLSFPNIEHKFNADSSNFAVSISGGHPAKRDPAILATVTSDSPFEIQCDSSPTVDFTEIEDGLVSASGTISITYEFTPTPARQPFSLRALGSALSSIGLKRRIQSWL